MSEGKDAMQVVPNGSQVFMALKMIPTSALTEEFPSELLNRLKGKAIAFLPIFEDEGTAYKILGQDTTLVVLNIPFDDQTEIDHGAVYNPITPEDVANHVNKNGGS